MCIVSDLGWDLEGSRTSAVLVVYTVGGLPATHYISTFRLAPGRHVVPDRHRRGSEWVCLTSVWQLPGFILPAAARLRPRNSCDEKRHELTTRWHRRRDAAVTLLQPATTLRQSMMRALAFGLFAASASALHLKQQSAKPSVLRLRGGLAGVDAEQVAKVVQYISCANAGVMTLAPTKAGEMYGVTETKWTNFFAQWSGIIMLGQGITALLAGGGMDMAQALAWGFVPSCVVAVQDLLNDRARPLSWFTRRRRRGLLCARAPPS